MDCWFAVRNGHLFNAHNKDELMDGYARHITKHLLESRDRVMLGDSLVKQSADEQNIRDQGFTRPRVLLILPFKDLAYKFVNKLIALLPEKMQKEIANREKFENEFGFDESGMTEEEKQSFERKPKDFQDMFSGNIDDAFRLGISLRNKGIKLFTEFYKSDLIIASPLGLRMLVGNSVVNGKTKSSSWDFLSSIEICVLDAAEAFSMQNIEHLQLIFNEMNRIPTESHGADFSRVREWVLNDWSRYYRQTIILSGYMNPDLNILFNKSCSNWRGKVKVRQRYEGCFSYIIPTVRHMFNRFEVQNMKELDEARFNFFTKDVFPNYRSAGHERTLIFVPSYFDFIRLRNYFKSERLNFGMVTEYTERREIDKFRSQFENGRIDYLFVTERFWYFRRNRFKGVSNIIFYGVPENSHFYAEALNCLGTEGDHTCISLICRYDSLSLERVLGTDRTTSLLASDRHTYLFC
jgi:U3 small nucleolar RNA-associated protein 25